MSQIHLPNQGTLPSVLDALPVTNQNRNSTFALPTSPMKGRGSLSARLRMMQRGSIYEPKQFRTGNRTYAGAATQVGDTFPQNDDNTIPETQIIDRHGAENRGPSEELAVHSSRPSPRKSLIVKLNIPRVNTQKVKVEEDAPIPRVTRSQAKRIKAAGQTQAEVLAGSSIVVSPKRQVMDEPAAKRRKLNHTRASDQSLPRANPSKKAVANSASRSTNLAKASPRKATMPTKHEELVSPSVQSPSKKPSLAVKVAASPQKKSTLAPKATSKEATQLDSDFLAEAMLSRSPTVADMSSLQETRAVQPNAVAKASRARNPSQLDDNMSASSRTIEVASSPRKKNIVPSKAAVKAPRTKSPVRTADTKSRGSRFSSPKKTYSKSKVRQEKSSEVQHDEHNFMDDNEW